MLESYLLDTNIILGLVTNSPWARWAVDEFELNREGRVVLTSVISQGEIIKLARKRGWQAKRWAKLEKCLLDFPQLNINNPRIIDAYATIGAWTEGASVDAPNSAPPPSPAIRMSQNDLWIAATAHAADLKLLSTDKGFAHLDKIWIEHIYVDQGNRA